MIEELHLTDQAVLDLLRQESELSVNEMVDRLGVTATAIRQRLNRLLAKELIDRVDSRKNRGRPVHQYRLTEKGQRTAGDNLADLAGVLWAEIQNIPDPQVKRTVMSGVVERLAKKYADQVTGQTLPQRMEAVARMFGERRIPSSVEESAGSPVLKVLGCPYPELVDEGHDICDMEKQLFEVLFDSEIKVDRCHCGDAGHCCTFQPISSE